MSKCNVRVIEKEMEKVPMEKLKVREKGLRFCSAHTGMLSASTVLA